MFKKLKLVLETRKKIDPVTGCWLYIGCLLTSGYGIIGHNKKYYRVHRLSLAIHDPTFKLDSKLLALHKIECPNKHCFNPEHLYAGNNCNNQQDVLKAGRNSEKNKIHCPKGHEYNEKNTSIDYYTGSRHCKVCDKLRKRNT